MKSAGKVWFGGFMERHHKLSSWHPELTSLARASGFNKVVVHTILYVLENIVDENQITYSGL
jgi:hypothetical protein